MKVSKDIDGWNMTVWSEDCWSSRTRSKGCHEDTASMVLTTQSFPEITSWVADGAQSLDPLRKNHGKISIDIFPRCLS